MATNKKKEAQNQRKINLKIEIVAFYPCRIKAIKSFLIGTLHIKFIDLKMDFRGIRVFQKAKNLTFFPPRGVARDENTGLIKHYPILNFNDVDKNKDFIHTLRNMGKKYIEEKHSECLLTPKH